MSVKKKSLVIVSIVLCLILGGASSCTTNDPVNATTGATKTA